MTQWGGEKDFQYTPEEVHPGERYLYINTHTTTVDLEFFVVKILSWFA